MKTACEYLDQVKETHSLTSDYQLASYLGISQAAISRYRNKKKYLDNYTALIIAEALNIDPLEIIAGSSFERAKKPEQKKAWKSLLKQINSSTAALLLAIVTIPETATTLVDCILC